MTRLRYDENEIDRLLDNWPGLAPELAACIYVSRLLGSDPSLVLHGGGNTSVKTGTTNIFGEKIEVLYIKGSGIDMATIEPEGFAGMDLSALGKFRNIEEPGDDVIANQLALNKIDAASPAPSVEVFLHAFLPHRFVLHTHADNILALTNRREPEPLIHEVLGHDVCVVGYEKSGLPLAKKVAKAWENKSSADTVVVLNHGIFTFSDDAGAAFERMISHVKKAKAYLAKAGPHVFPADTAMPSDSMCARVAQTIRGVCAHKSDNNGPGRFIVDVRRSPDMVAISLDRNAARICESGVITPDHAIRTKNRIAFLPAVPERDDDLRSTVDDVTTAYIDAYRKYTEKYSHGRDLSAMNDPTPRIFLIAGVGLMALGETRRAAVIGADIAEHTIRLKHLCGDEYEPISEQHVFDMEYWPFQLAKIKRKPPSPLKGQVALVTGAAGAIGFGIADRLMAAGACVVVSDVDKAGLEHVSSILAERHSPEQVEPIMFDVTDYKQVERGFIEAGIRFGGVDIVVPNAGTAHVARIEELDTSVFNRVIQVNLIGTFNTIKASVPVFRRQGTGGNIVVISTKNVFDPGAAFGAYSASKAGAHQISKIAAIELAELGVRTNMVNPDAVFGDDAVPSKLWEMIGPDRMKARGLDPDGLKEYYRRRNLLKESVLAEHVGNVVVFFASNLSPTTGASFPVDGGNPAAFPR